MGKCKYCGLDAGFLRKKHDECERLHINGVGELKRLLNACFQNKDDFNNYKSEIGNICRKAYISSEILDLIYLDCFDEAVERYLNDGVIDEKEEHCVATFMQMTRLSQSQLNSKKSLEKVVQSKIVEDIINGKTPTDRLNIGGGLPFLLSRNENIIWVADDVKLLVQKTQTAYVGENLNVGRRMGKRMYVSYGRFTSKPVEKTFFKPEGVGQVCLTDKNIYFHASQKAIKIPFSRIFSLEPYSDGIGINSDGNPPMIFVNLNAWFTYNVISNLKEE